MKWYDACRDSTMRRAERHDEVGDWRITVDGHCEVIARESKEAQSRDMEPDQIYDMSTAEADKYRDWEGV